MNYTESWNYLYCESVVKHDPRLHLIKLKTTNNDQTEVPNYPHILMLDSLAAQNASQVRGQPTTIYLNNSFIASKTKSIETRKNCCSMDARPVLGDEVTEEDSRIYNYEKDEKLLKLYESVSVDPRKRWTVMYSRTFDFPGMLETLTAAVDHAVRKRTCCRVPETQNVSVGEQIGIQESHNVMYRMVESRTDPIQDEISEIKSCKVSVQETTGLLESDAARWSTTRSSVTQDICVETKDDVPCNVPFSSSNVLLSESSVTSHQAPDAFALIDERSGTALCHIALLCRDMIYECNLCTDCIDSDVITGICHACCLRIYHNSFLAQYSSEDRNTAIPKSGSFASGSVKEGCNLPTFVFKNSNGETSLKRSDIDIMDKLEIGFEVGFGNETGRDIEAEIDTEDTPPGYLRLWHWREGMYLDYTTEMKSGPAYTIESVTEPTDRVSCIDCPTWPPIAHGWIDRERRSAWPSQETVRRIVSMGCHIVFKSHESSKHKNIEFRFSFSLAEIILFETLSLEQKQCLVAFKALMKRVILKADLSGGDRNGLKTYHMKNIFMWVCETIPATQWQTTSGWSLCLLRLIDELRECLNKKSMPGYFIPCYNLLDCSNVSDLLLVEINKLRNDPLMYAVEFIDSLEWFYLSYSGISGVVANLFRTYDRFEDLLTEQLIFLQAIIDKTEQTRKVSFWRKANMLRLFARWCKQNSFKIQLKPWQCLTPQMSLFDVVYLDIVHRFDVPVEYLLEFADREWSTELTVKLASRYSRCTTHANNRQAEHASEYGYLKTLVLLQHALNCKHISGETIKICLRIFLSFRNNNIALRVLSSSDEEKRALFEYFNVHQIDTSTMQQENANDKNTWASTQWGWKQLLQN